MGIIESSQQMRSPSGEVSLLSPADDETGAERTASELLCAMEVDSERKDPHRPSPNRNYVMDLMRKRIDAALPIILAVVPMDAA
ncbi:hypothetical protein EVAR_33306_1 [Eumeta japonica]|uniref:Uncharacterized protein n=1 Tax=Eumeta variegata TaxID=151549 RepID=A0A4C1WGP2_EUMVA|nr:hypothetical protein EVAR_33306_1 [Eumeta japonica]